MYDVSQFPNMYLGSIPQDVSRARADRPARRTTRTTHGSKTGVKSTTRLTSHHAPGCRAPPTEHRARSTVTVPPIAPGRGREARSVPDALWTDDRDDPVGGLSGGVDPDVCICESYLRSSAQYIIIKPVRICYTVLRRRQPHQEDICHRHAQRHRAVHTQLAEFSCYMRIEVVVAESLPDSTARVS